MNAESAARSLHVLYLIARREFLTSCRKWLEGVTVETAIY